MHLRWAAGAAGYSLLVNSYVAAVTIFVRYRMTDLAGKVPQVLLVLRITLGIGPDVSVAVFTLDCIRVLISVGYGLV